MQPISREETRAKINQFAANRVPFFFCIDAFGQKGLVVEAHHAAEWGILYDFHGVSNTTPQPRAIQVEQFDIHPISFEQYHKAYLQVIQHIQRGDTYLLNLTFSTKIRTSLSLEDIFYNSKARYKFLWNGRFVVFSPEIFIQIKEGKIFSFPMKGTIDASIPHAKERILSDKKEFFEHNTIVDLIRNDLAMVSEQVTVERFRYLEHIHTNRKELLQVSSEISGVLPENFYSKLGDILFTLLPAGSVTGAPKEKTVAIIQSVENDQRGFYTGICGFFDGTNLDSAVMIRFIEKNEHGLSFRSGGGITALSDAQSEYNELIDKVYVPIV